MSGGSTSHLAIESGGYAFFHSPAFILILLTLVVFFFIWRWIR